MPISTAKPATPVWGITTAITAAAKASRPKAIAAQRQAPEGTPMGVAEREREASINAILQDLVNQSFPTPK